jgi:LTXXQ motif family protein
MHSLTKSSVGVRVVAATFVGALALVGPVMRPSADLACAATTNKAGNGDNVETRIKTLHSQLKITPAQEALWNNVAQAMRDNAKAMEDLQHQQAEAEKSASAPDMVNAYAKTMDAHAEGIHKFVPIFQALYDSMSEAQKKTADVVFRERVRAASARHKS